MSTMTTTTYELRELVSGAVPAIAVSFADQISDVDLTQAAADGLDVAELRIDRYRSPAPDHVLAVVRRFRSFPTIGTIRTAAEGGQWTGSDAERLSLFKLVIPEVDAIDIELNSTPIIADVISEAQSQNKMVIVSNHNFERTPTTHELTDMAHRAKALGADLVKLSAKAESPEDIRALAAFTLENAELGLIVIAMGEHGTTSRVFFPALGSRLTYAYAHNWPVSGQLTFQATFEELLLFYPAFRERKINDLQLLEDA